MPRRREVPKREVVPDPVYQSTLASRFINTIMTDGKKSTAERIFYGAMEVIKGKVGDDPIRTFKKAVDNIKPALEVKARRVGGATYQIPVEVKPARRLSLALRWLISNSKGRNEKEMKTKLANEILDASNMKGGAIKKKEDMHRMAEANKAFAHYRW
ncbi:MAG: 30S ribosomal protein S7 [Acidobacteriota bacterium]